MWQLLKTDLQGVLKVLASPRGEPVANVVETDSLPSDAPPPKRVHLIWRERPVAPDNLPTLVLTPHEEVREFLAWASTYLDGYRPLTALCRVMDWPTFEQTRRAGRHTGPPQVDIAGAALCLAEALVSGRGRRNPATIAISTCEGTYAFSMARCIALGFDPRLLERRWYMMRDVARQYDRMPVEVLEPICDVLVYLSGRKAEPDMMARLTGIVLACQDLTQKGEIPTSRLRHLVEGVDIDSVLESMRQTREQRVTVFERVLREFAMRRLSRTPEGEFFCGYVASLLNPGSLEYFSLIMSHLDAHPTLLYWYALCEALHPQTKILNQFGGLCRRILRDIRRPELLLEPPQADIALDELEVLARSRGGIDYVRAAEQCPARVELLPMISVYSNLGSTPDEGPFPPDSRSSDIRAWMQQIGTAIERLRDVYEQFGTPPSDPDLFTPKKKRSRRN